MLFRCAKKDDPFFEPGTILDVYKDGTRFTITEKTAFLIVENAPNITDHTTLNDIAEKRKKIDLDKFKAKISETVLIDVADKTKTRPPFICTLTAPDEKKKSIRPPIAPQTNDDSDDDQADDGEEIDDDSDDDSGKTNAKKPQRKNTKAAQKKKRR
jgi:hypothetical protein